MCSKVAVTLGHMTWAALVTSTFFYVMWIDVLYTWVLNKCCRRAYYLACAFLACSYSVVQVNGTMHRGSFSNEMNLSAQAPRLSEFVWPKLLSKNDSQMSKENGDGTVCHTPDSSNRCALSYLRSGSRTSASNSNRRKLCVPLKWAGHTE